MADRPILPSVANMRAGDHYCGIYRTDEDHRAFVVDYVRDGINRKEKVLYLVNVHTVDQLRAMLDEAGIAADPLLDSGQLRILAAKDAYLRDGEFSPDRMIALIEEETEKALSEGYPALRATGEMTWALAGEPGSERLVEYESRLNRYFPTSKCYAVCQYDRRYFDAEMLLDIMCCHPQVLYGRHGYDNSNLYYVPPDTFLGGDRASAMLDRWLDNLTQARVSARA